MAIVSALEYNTFFRGLKVSHTRLSNDTLERILHVMKRSMWLEELQLEGLGLKSDFIHKLAVSVISNNNPALKTIDLNHNLIEDKGELRAFASLIFAVRLTCVTCVLVNLPFFLLLLCWHSSGASSLCALIGKLVQGLIQLILGFRWVSTLSDVELVSIWILGIKIDVATKSTF